MQITRPQQFALAGLGALSLLLIYMVLTTGGGSKATLSGNTLNFTCGNTAINGSHYLKLGNETTIQGRVVSVKREPFMRSCGLDYALIKWVAEDTYKNCLATYMSIGQCERERLQASGGSPVPGFIQSVLMLVPTATTNKFWKMNYEEGRLIALKVREVTAIDHSDFLGGGGGFTVSQDPHYWVEAFQ